MTAALYRGEKEEKIENPSMLTTSTLPPARERARDGLPFLDWSKKPAAADAWPDKIRLKLIGHVHWNERGSFYDYLCRIAPSRFISDQPTVGRKFKGIVEFGSALTGVLWISMTSDGRADEAKTGEAKLTLHLNLNPTVTRVSAIRRNRDPMEALGLRRFFTALPSTEEVYESDRLSDDGERSLDGKDNVLLTLEELGGQTREQRLAARDTFLQYFERNVRTLVCEMLEPTDASWLAEDVSSSDYRVAPDWSGLVLEQAEIYFERRLSDPVALVRRLHDRGLDLARRIKVQMFADKPADTTYALEQDDGYPHLIVPLTGKRNIELSVYAKTNHRVRFEVRFRKGFGGVLRGQSTGEDRLASLLKRLMQDAEKRLPWDALKSAVAVPPTVDVADIANLIERLEAVTRAEPRLFNPLVRQIMITGGVVADENRNPGIGRAIGALVRDGTLERWTVQLKEQRSSRRYGLTSRFAEVRRKMLSGFVPEEDGLRLDNWEPTLSNDHFDEAAALNGGRSMVYRYLDQGGKRRS